MMLTPLTARNGQKNQKSLLAFAIGSVLASAATPVHDLYRSLNRREGFA